MKRIVALAAGVMAVVMASQMILGQPSRAQGGRGNEQELPPLITVSGSGQSFSEPDEGTVRLGVEAQERRAREAQASANTKASALLAAIKKLGINEDQIRSTRITLQPIYAPQTPERVQEPRIVAYRANNTVSVRVLNLQQVGPVIDAGLDAGANRLEGVHFGLRNDLPARQQALEQAVKEARQKADTMARALGVRLGRLQTAQEGGVHVNPPPMMMAGTAEMRGRGDSTPVSPGEVEVGASVTLQYRIDQ